MSKPNVSIIVPVYNVEQYLRRCLDSIIVQTYTNWECIIIDDGSTDSSGAICDEYAQKDSRITVIHKENGGLAFARQCGIDNIHGEYVITIDSDDWVDADHIENMYNAMTENDADMVLCGYYMNDDSEQIYIKNEPSNTVPLTVRNETLSRKLHAGLWCKMFKVSLFKDYDVKFPKYSYYEDMYTFVSCLQYATKIVYIPKATYHYRYNPNSYTNNKNIDKRFRLYREFVENMQLLNDKYKLDIVPSTRIALDRCINFSKRNLILAYFDKDLSSLLLYFQDSMKWKYVKNIGDLFFLLGSRYNFMLPYKLRAFICKK